MELLKVAGVETTSKENVEDYTPKYTFSIDGQESYKWVENDKGEHALFAIDHKSKDWIIITDTRGKNWRTQEGNRNMMKILLLGKKSTVTEH